MASTTRQSLLQTLGPGERSALRAVDVAIALAVVGVPFLLGGTRAPGHFLLVFVSFLAAVGWLTFCSVRPGVLVKWTGAEFFILCGLLLGVLQIIPLSGEIIDGIAPRTKTLFRWWPETGVATGLWPYLSFCPELSRSELTLWVCYALLFLTTAQRVRGIADVESLLRLIAVSSIAMAVLGLAQLLAGNGKFLWWYEHPHLSTAKVATGSFINRNHFASFLALGVGPLLWWSWRRASANSSNSEFLTGPKSRGAIAPWLLGLALVILVFAVLLSRSRGGAIALFVAVLVFLGVQLRRNPSRQILTIFIGAAGLVGICLSIYGYGAVSQRLSNWELSNRLHLWRANWDVFTDFPLVGTGLNTHRLAYPLHYENPSDGLMYQYAESSYVQMLSEMGVAGLILAILGVRLIGSWCVRGLRGSPSQRHAMAVLALTASLSAHAVHAAGDSLWSVPGLMTTVSVMAACAWRLFDLARTAAGQTSREPPGMNFLHTFRLPRFAWGLATASVFVAGLVFMGEKLSQLRAWPHWERYERLAQIGADDEHSPSEIVDQRIAALEAAARFTPADSSLASRLAAEHQLAFKFGQLRAANVMSLEEIAAVARDPMFATQEERLAWLEKVLGDNAIHLHAIEKFSQKALLGSPARGTEAMQLVQLDFLSPELQADALEHHALSVRPHDGGILFSVGQRAFGQGQTRRGFHYWQAACRKSPETEQLILRTLANLLPAPEILESLEISRAGMEAFWHMLEENKSGTDYQYVSRYLAQKCQRDALEVTGDERANLLLEAFAAYDAVDEDKQAEHCLNQALRANPESLLARHEAARWYFNRKEFDVAQRHIQWCLLREPENSTLRDMQKQSQLNLLSRNTQRTETLQ